MPTPCKYILHGGRRNKDKMVILYTRFILHKAYLELLHWSINLGAVYEGNADVDFQRLFSIIGEKTTYAINLCKHYLLECEDSIKAVTLFFPFTSLLQ